MTQYFDQFLQHKVLIPQIAELMISQANTKKIVSGFLVCVDLSYAAYMQHKKMGSCFIRQENDSFWETYVKPTFYAACMQHNSLVVKGLILYDVFCLQFFEWVSCIHPYFNFIVNLRKNVRTKGGKKMQTSPFFYQQQDEFGGMSYRTFFSLKPPATKYHSVSQ